MKGLVVLMNTHTQGSIERSLTRAFNSGLTGLLTSRRQYCTFSLTFNKSLGEGSILCYLLTDFIIVSKTLLFSLKTGIR